MMVFKLGKATHVVQAAGRRNKAKGTWRLFCLHTASAAARAAPQLRQKEGNPGSVHDSTEHQRSSFPNGSGPGGSTVHSCTADPRGSCTACLHEHLVCNRRIVTPHALVDPMHAAFGAAAAATAAHANRRHARQPVWPAAAAAAAATATRSARCLTAHRAARST
eukprot:207915-Chlamydomonas_euryale.AAC.2